MLFFVARQRAAFKDGRLLNAAPRFAAESREQPPHAGVPFVHSTVRRAPCTGGPAARPAVHTNACGQSPAPSAGSGRGCFARPVNFPARLKLRAIFSLAIKVLVLV